VAARAALLAVALSLAIQSATSAQNSDQPKAKQNADPAKAKPKPGQAKVKSDLAKKGPSPQVTPVAEPPPTVDVPRVVQAAELRFAMKWHTREYQAMVENAAREVTGRPDGVGDVTPDDLQLAEEAINRELLIRPKMAPPPTLLELARQSGRPQIPGLQIVYLNPLGPLTQANNWKYLLAHQTETPPGTAYRLAKAQFLAPTKRGVQVWVETDGVVYWSIPENVIPTQGDGANRNDNKYIDNSMTYRIVVKEFIFGVEFIGNAPDVTGPVTAAQMQSWLLLVPFLQERYGIPAELIYAHKWIDLKDERYCEGCELATEARKLGYVPGRGAAAQNQAP